MENRKLINERIKKINTSEVLKAFIINEEHVRDVRLYSNKLATYSEIKATKQFRLQLSEQITKNNNKWCKTVVVSS